MSKDITRAVHVRSGHVAESVTWMFSYTNLGCRVFRITENYLISKRHKWRHKVVYDQHSPTLNRSHCFIEPPQDVIDEALEFFRSKLEYQTKRF
jgi:hypothetical protein